MYNRAKFWVAKNFKSPKEVINLDDPESGTLVLDVSFKYDCGLSTGYATHSGYITYTISLFFKEGRYKYIFSNFRHPTQGLIYDTEDHPKEFKYKSERRYYNNLWDDILTQIDLEYAVASVVIDSVLSKSLESEKDW